MRPAQQNPVPLTLVRVVLIARKRLRRTFTAQSQQAFGLSVAARVLELVDVVGRSKAADEEKGAKVPELADLPVLAVVSIVVVVYASHQLGIRS